MVIAVFDQNMNQTYGQSFDQYQRCFSIEDEHGESYSIIEDYLESVSLQTIEIGDTVSIEGYLVDENNALVIPSKVYRPSDGVVLGTDTFLFVNPSKATQSAQQSSSVDIGSSMTTSPKAGVTIVDAAPIGNEGENVGSFTITR